MRIDVGGYELHADVHEAPKPRRTAILLHGFAGTGKDWEKILPAFQPDTTVVTLDLIGHGESDTPRDERAYRFDEVSRSLLRVADAVHAEAPVWIGYSFGGRLLFDLALRHPRRVTGLVLESAHPGLEPAAARLRQARDAEDANLLRDQGVKAFLEKWHERPIFDSRRGRRPGWLQEVKRKETTNTAAGLAKVLEGLGLGRQPPFLPDLHKVTTRALILAGVFDVEYVNQARALQHALPNARTELVPYCGHAVHLEDPDTFQDVIREYLDNLSPGVIA